MWGGSCDKNWAPVLELALSASICIIRHCAAPGKWTAGHHVTCLSCSASNSDGSCFLRGCRLGQHQGICSECCSSDLGLCLFLVSAISCTCHCPLYPTRVIAPYKYIYIYIYPAHACGCGGKCRCPQGPHGLPDPLELELQALGSPMGVLEPI